MNFKENLQQLLELNHLKQADLCRMTGIQTSLMSDYMKGNKSPTIKNALLIADAFNVSLDTLVGKITISELSIKESNLIKKYRSLDPYGQDTISYMLDREVERVTELQQNGEQHIRWIDD